MIIDDGIINCTLRDDQCEILNSSTLSPTYFEFKGSFFSKNWWSLVEPTPSSAYRKERGDLNNRNWSTARVPPANGKMMIRHASLVLSNFFAFPISADDEQNTTREKRRRIRAFTHDAALAAVVPPSLCVQLIHSSLPPEVFRGCAYQVMSPSSFPFLPRPLFIRKKRPFLCNSIGTQARFFFKLEVDGKSRRLVVATRLRG